MSKIILASEVVDYYLPICVSLTAPRPLPIVSHQVILNSNQINPLEFLVN